MVVKVPSEKESAYLIDGETGKLEVRFHVGHSDGILSKLNGLVIICHPHPVHGGTMDNKVVTTLMRTYRDLGVDVVRFNFRGVGASEGQFDHGVGELKDTLDVANWALEQFTDKTLLLAGFSFGSAMAAQASYRLDGLRHLTLVAPPIERYDYDNDGSFTVPTVIIQGGKDERVDSEGVYAWQSQLRSSSTLIRYDDASHFFHGYLTQVKDDLSKALLSDLMP